MNWHSINEDNVKGGRVIGGGAGGDRRARNHGISANSSSHAESRWHLNELTEGGEIAQTSIKGCMCANLWQSVNGEGKTLDQVHLGCHPFTQVVWHLWIFNNTYTFAAWAEGMHFEWGACKKVFLFLDFFIPCLVDSSCWTSHSTTSFTLFPFKESCLSLIDSSVLD